MSVPFTGKSAIYLRVLAKGPATNEVLAQAARTHSADVSRTMASWRVKGLVINEGGRGRGQHALYALTKLGQEQAGRTLDPTVGLSDLAAEVLGDLETEFTDGASLLMLQEWLGEPAGKLRDAIAELKARRLVHPSAYRIHAGAYSGRGQVSGNRKDRAA